MKTFTLHDLMNRTMTGDEVFVLYPEALDELQQRNERITELESRIANVERAAVRGLCVSHHWGAPPGEDDLPCPYCIGVLRTR